ncbi:ABC transporter ATP-binding protein [Occallatibacter savannae]|uniref:ABC transporter ATP-binding protein n=1 Tax=Occallatibacter savannae TaxID=1002691 RepID=UPI000D698B59|nr:ABC transporter ATP-binding protein [Occallatibacter savannae]
MTVESKASDSSVVIRASQVWKSYDEGTISVLNGVDLEAYKGEAIALCGPSGCGKSTLLHLIGGLDEPTRGTITVNGKTLGRNRDMVQFMRHEVGFVFQLHNLVPDLTMEENCLLPAVAAGTPRGAALDRLKELAVRTGLGHRLKHRIQKLSGGERQRTAICRALMNRPGILLADEPTGSLDEKTSGAVFDLLLDLAHTEHVTLLMATHDRALAAACDRVLEMHDGRIRTDR